MRVEQKRKWRNFAGNQESTPALTFWPESQGDIIEIIRQAEGRGGQVRAIGSSHSWSDVSVTGGYLVCPERLDRILDIEQYGLLATIPFDRHHLIHLESGVTIRALNRELHDRRLALINLGGFDGQTVAGVVSTSTHGSGITFGPLSDFVRSVEIVADAGKTYRIEPSSQSGRALTDPVAYAIAYPDISTHQLIQDDQWFNAVVVSIGCLGILYSLVIEVRDSFLLKETRVKTTWESVRARLANGGIYSTPAHYELIINPYKVHGRNSCLITTRVETQQPGNRERSVYIKYKEALYASSLWVKILSLLHPSWIKDTLDTAISALEDKDYTEQSFKVFHIGDANYIPALSSEFALPIKDDRFIAGIDRFLEVAEDVGRREGLYLTVPTAIRFVKGSAAFLSPQSGRDTCMIEVIALAGVPKSARIMQRIEEALQEFEVRPHWGQLNHISKEQLLPMYGNKLAPWLEIARQLNAHQTFDSPFAKRVGLSQ